MDDLPAGTWDNLFYPPECNFPGEPQDPQKYTYFRKAIGDQNIKGWMADASVLCYGRSRKELMAADKFGAILRAAGFQDFDLIGDWERATGTLGYFARRADFAILAFRGTQKDNWKDFITDFNAAPVNPNDPRGSVVHTGFWDAVDSVWTRTLGLLENYLAKQPKSPIYLAGHSLGGALATIALWRFQNDAMHAGVSLHTIGCPRVGNRQFCSEVENRATQGIFRYMDGNDLVTHVPPEFLGYDHPAGGIEIGSRPRQEAGEAFTLLRDADVAAWDFVIGSDPPADLVDHSPVRYCYYLWK